MGLEAGGGDALRGEVGEDRVGAGTTEVKVRGECAARVGVAADSKLGGGTLASSLNDAIEKGMTGGGKNATGRGKKRLLGFQNAGKVCLAIERGYWRKGGSLPDRE